MFLPVHTAIYPVTTDKLKEAGSLNKSNYRLAPLYSVDFRKYGQQETIMHYTSAELNSSSKLKTLHSN